MRKFLVRKNFDENNDDPLNAPNRTVFYEKERKPSESIPHNNPSENDESQSEAVKSQSNKKEKPISDESGEILNVHAKKIFHESLSAINEYDKKRMDSIYEQLEKEKSISKEPKCIFKLSGCTSWKIFVIFDNHHCFLNWCIQFFICSSRII